VRVDTALAAAREILDTTDARALLAHCAALAPAQLIAFPERELAHQTANLFFALCRRRAAGEPLAYLTGEREFFGLSFAVSPAVLIPRPETELLVELALARIPLGAAVEILDLGTGSGCIAVALAIHRPDARIVAIDASAAALALASSNAERHAIDNIDFMQSDWFAAIPERRFQLIVTNPPYVAASDPHLHSAELRCEPIQALHAGGDGLSALRRITQDASRWITPGGWLIIEHGHDQGAACAALLHAAGFSPIESHRDLAGIPRAAVAQQGGLAWAT
jgi:release factor glutamine methyltransferase